MKEKDLILLILSGNKVAFEELYQLYEKKVYNLALSYIQNLEDAEEVTQDVFINVYRNLSKFKGDASFSTWIYRITVNTSLNFLKKKKRFSFLKFMEAPKERPDFEHPGVLLENKENAAILFKIIDKLPDNQKTAFILSFIEELSRKEVAQIMEISLKAVESLLQRGKKNLRLFLKKDHD